MSDDTSDRDLGWVCLLILALSALFMGVGIAKAIQLISDVTG